MSSVQLQNDSFLRALAGKPVERTPIWIMRQAGRHLPEFRAIREKVDFMTVCKTPELACEVALQPLARYDLDASIVFSDILTIPDAMGLGLSFEKGQGPVFERPLRHPNQLTTLDLDFDVCDRLGYVGQAVSTTKSALANRIPLIGFGGSPFTLATYMIEGSGSKHFVEVKRWLYQHPQQLLALLDSVTDCLITYLQMQADAGADALMIFDSWGGSLLDTHQYTAFSLVPMQRCINTLKVSHPHLPIIIYARGCDHTLAAIAKSGCQAIGIDHLLPLDEAKRRLKDCDITLQGNLDPAVLLTDEPTVRHEAQRVLTRFGQGPAHIFNLGVGIYPSTPPELVKTLVDTVHAYSN